MDAVSVVFWIFILAMDLLIPLIMIGFGRLFLTKAPQNINATFGYRTTMSMKNQDTWDFAHKYCGKLWFKCGIVLLPLSVIPLLFILNKDITTIANVSLIIATVQLVVLLGSIFPTEAALKKTFDKNGIRR